MQLLRDQILEIVPLDENELTFFMSKFRLKEFAKNDYYCREGQVMKSVAFISKGIFRYFYIKNGEEKTGQFFFENGWVADYFSFLTKSPSQMFVQALEDSQLYTLSYEDMKLLYKEVPKIERFGRIMAEQIFISAQHRNKSLLNNSPEERYTELIRNRPKVTENIPLYMIASYLGIKPESLSRIRKRIHEQKDELNPNQFFR